MTPEHKFHPLRFHIKFWNYIVNTIDVFEIPPNGKGGLHSATDEKYVIRCVR